MVPKRNQIVGFLDKNPGRSFCDDCLTEALGFSPVDVTMSTANFADARDERVIARFGWCSQCSRHDRVVASRKKAAS